MIGRAGGKTDMAIVNVWKREVGELSTRNFSHRFSAAKDLVLRLDIDRQLEKHQGCVNCVSFDSNGDILVSGSDDRQVILWDWQTGVAKLSFHTGHNGNIFQAKTMPYSDNRSFVTCAEDGQVRHSQILDQGRVEIAMLAKHQGQAHDLAIEPGSPHTFYTCGEDGFVQFFDLRTKDPKKLFRCRPVNDVTGSALAIRLYSIAIDPRNPNFFAVVGTDEYTRLYDIRKCNLDGSTIFDRPVDYFCPEHLIDGFGAEITGLAFSDQNELLVSYHDEGIYLFSRDLGLGSNFVPTSQGLKGRESSEAGSDHPSSSLKPDIEAENSGPKVYEGHRNCNTVKGVNFFGPGCEYVVSGSDCGRIFIWTKKDGELIRVMTADRDVVNCVVSHPCSSVLASSGMGHDVKLWTPKATNRAALPENINQKGQYGWGDYDDDNDDDSDFDGGELYDCGFDDVGGDDSFDEDSDIDVSVFLTIDDHDPDDHSFI